MHWKDILSPYATSYVIKNYPKSSRFGSLDVDHHTFLFSGSIEVNVSRPTQW